jgi:hypothetical protein
MFDPFIVEKLLLEEVFLCVIEPVSVFENDSV